MFLQVPSILFSGVSSILSFLGTSYFLTDQIIAQKSIELIVGVITAVVVVMQSLSTTLQYSAKREGHRIFARGIEQLLRRTEFEIIDSNEVNFMNDVENEILSLQSKLNFVMPRFIIEKYQDDDSKIFESSVHVSNDNQEQDNNEIENAMNDISNNEPIEQI
tara:strand:- start:1220 stop:1705 length:486 start_codon:yes stop_codon:yes gene_type:complete